LIYLAASAQVATVGENELTPVQDAPPVGTFYSLTLLQAPFPFNPFPELPLYDAGDGIYVYDDRSVDYLALRTAEFSAPSAGAKSSGVMLAGGTGGGAMSMSGPPPPSGGGGSGGSGSSVSNPPPYSATGLKLTIPVLTNGYVYTTVFDHDPGLAYDVYTKTNLNSVSWVFGCLGVIGQTNYYLLQSAFPNNLFLRAASGGDSDGDGLPDNWEVLYGLNPHNAADASQDPDGDGLNNLQEFYQGGHPTSAPAFQVLITSPRNLIP